MSKGTCHLAWWPECNLWKSHGLHGTTRNEPTPASCPLAFIHPHTHSHTINVKDIQVFSSFSKYQTYRKVYGLCFVLVYYNKDIDAGPGTMMRRKQSRTCLEEGTTLIPGLGWGSGSHRLIQWPVFSKEEGIGPLAFEFAVGSIGGQCNSPFPKEQEQQSPSGVQFRLPSQHTNSSSSISLPPACLLLSLPSLHHPLTRFPQCSAACWALCCLCASRLINS